MGTWGIFKMAGTHGKNDEEIDSDVSEIEDDDKAAPLKPGKERPWINNKEGMESKLKDMTGETDWLERFDVVTDLSDVKIPGKENKEEQKVITPGSIQDDFKREMMFYCQAQIAAKEALSKLRNLGVPTERPEDYFAEMLKTDAHMQKVRSKLLERKQGMEKSEKAKKQRQLKKIGKKVQQEVLQKRQAEKRKMLETVDRIKKGKGKFKKSFDADDNKDMFDVSTDNKKPGSKRKHKDEKFGFGGKKRKLKKNTSDSSSQDMGSFKPAVHSNKRFNKNTNKKKGNTNKTKVKRLGKSRRL